MTATRVAKRAGGRLNFVVVTAVDPSRPSLVTNRLTKVARGQAIELTEHPKAIVLRLAAGHGSAERDRDSMLHGPRTYGSSGEFNRAIRVLAKSAHAEVIVADASSASRADAQRTVRSVKSAKLGSSKVIVVLPSSIRFASTASKLHGLSKSPSKVFLKGRIGGSFHVGKARGSK